MSDLLKYYEYQVIYNWEIYFIILSIFLVLVYKNIQIQIINNILQEKSNEEEYTNEDWHYQT